MQRSITEHLLHVHAWLIIKFIGSENQTYLMIIKNNYIIKHNYFIYAFRTYFYLIKIWANSWAKANDGNKWPSIGCRKTAEKPWWALNAHQSGVGRYDML